MIDLEGVEKRFDDDTHALRGVSLSISEGELVALVGESGSGKTTTLKTINRLVEPTAGHVRVDGKNVAELDAIALRRSIGMVFQRFALFPHMTVGENVAVVPRLLGWADRDVASRVDELLALVGLDPATYRRRAPRELSGGQQQRVGVARALAARPRILLMDEPFGALDPVTRESLGQEVRNIHARLGLTTVMVTHDMTEALLLADRIAVMHAGQVVQIDTPHGLLDAPANERVRELVGWPRRQAEQLAGLARESGDVR